MAKRLHEQEVSRTYFSHACVRVASRGFFLQPTVLLSIFAVKMDNFMSEQGPDVIDINDFITDDYKDLLETGYFSTEIINSPYFKFSNLFKKEKHVYWYHGTCSLFVICFTGIINTAWELQ